MDDLIIRDRYKVVDRKAFPCDGCGACCSIYQLVDLHIADVFRMAEKLGIAPGEFFEKHVRVIEKDGAFTFAMDIQGGCRFLKDRKCTVYEARSDFCAFYPNSHSCLDLSQVQKKEMRPANPDCAAHRQPDDLILVPDIERMVDSRIFYMVKETYLAQYGGVYDDAGMRAAHAKGLAQVANPRMREIVHMQLLAEFLRNIPVDEKTGEPVLTKDEIKQIYQKMRKKL